MKCIATVDEVKKDLYDIIDRFFNAAVEISEKEEGAPATFYEMLDSLDFVDLSELDEIGKPIKFVLGSFIVINGKIYEYEYLPKVEK